MRAWTDYPFIRLGDLEGKEAPVRLIKVISYDGDKYCKIKVQGIIEEIKSGYIYTKPGAYGDVPVVTIAALEKLEDKNAS